MFALTQVSTRYAVHTSRTCQQPSSAKHPVNATCSLVANRHISYRHERPSNDIDTKNRVQYALEFSRVKVLQQYINEGFDLREFKGLWAASAKSFDIRGMEFLAAHVPELIDEADDNDTTALQLAVSKVDSLKVDFLLARNAKCDLPVKVDESTQRYYKLRDKVVSLHEYAEAIATKLDMPQQFGESFEEVILRKLVYFKMVGIIHKIWPRYS